MRRKIYFTLLLALAGVAGFSQEKSKLKFSSINQFGIASGESSTDFLLQTVNGIQYKTFFAGAGFAMDNYYEQTFPLFIDLRKSFLKKTSTPFVYADAGYSFKGKANQVEYEMSHKGGIYYATGIGYEFPLDKKVRGVLDIGYSYKKFSREVDNEPWRSSLHNFDTYDYSLNRISIKAGLRF